MRHLLKKLLLIVVCVLVYVSMCDTVYAEEKEKALFTLDAVEDVVVTITYEKDDISYKLISPSGQIITKDTDTDNITVFSGKTSTVVFIGQAEQGEWRIKYDKGSNESIGVSADIQDSSFFITEYNIGSIAEEKLPVNFVVSGRDNIYYTYRIVLTTNTQNLNGKELISGRGRTGEGVSIEVPFDKVNTYNEYYLLLYVTYDLNGVEIFDYSFSKAFEYTNSAMPKAMENVDITVEHDRGVMALDWKNYVSYGVSSVYVKAYSRDGSSIASAEYLMQDGYGTEIPYNKGDEIKLEITYKDSYGLISDVLIKEVDTEAEILTLPESGKVSSDIWSFGYKEAENIEAEFSVNGEEYVITLDGSGSKYITLPEKRNNIYITYKDLSGVVHQYQRSANISVMRPTIDLLHQIDGVTTEKSSIMISGITNAEFLTINSEAVNIENGIFVYKHNLGNGKNSIVIEAVIDDNVTKLSATITKKSAIGDSLVYLLIGLVVSFVGIVLILISMRKRKSDIKTESNTGGKAEYGRKLDCKLLLVIGWVFTVIVWAEWAVLMIYEGTGAYLKLAYESLEKAGRLLVFGRIFMWFAIGVSAIVLFGTLLYIIIRKYRKK